MASTFQDFMNGVLDGIGAPHTAQNYSIMTRWANFETGNKPLGHNNPFNTTQGSQYPKFNSVGVRIFPNVDVAIQETLATLKNGYYPNIVKGLQISGSDSYYVGAASKDLGTWGTGLGFLGASGKVTAGGNAGVNIGGGVNALVGGVGDIVKNPTAGTIFDSIPNAIAGFTTGLNDIVLKMMISAIGIGLILLGFYVIAKPQIKDAATKVSMAAVKGATAI